MNKSIENGINNSHTNCMKTAISIPDQLFEEVDKLAQENKTSRSQIFCSAIGSGKILDRCFLIISDLEDIHQSCDL
jgi:glycerol dehydrogenase-like iron-containing ADH family enzyme